MFSPGRTPTPLSGLDRSWTPASRADTETTYHSFNTVELYEPASLPRGGSALAAEQRAGDALEMIEQEASNSEAAHKGAREDGDGDETTEAEGSVGRRDSGYESTSAATATAGTRPSISSRSSSNRSSRHRIHRHHRRSSTQTSIAVGTGPSSRPNMQRASKSTPGPHSGQGLGSRPTSSNSFYQFPSLDGIPGSQQSTVIKDYGVDNQGASRAGGVGQAPPRPSRASTSYSRHPVPNVPVPTAEQPIPSSAPTPPPPSPPPQTTHYWTSDHTRRLEYAAIDAASRGVKGWFLRHIVPDCFVPKASRRLAFDDDRGSVRRYRLELQDDESVSHGGLGGTHGESGGDEKRRLRAWLRRQQQQDPSSKTKLKWLFGGN